MFACIVTKNRSISRFTWACLRPDVMSVLSPVEVPRWHPCRSKNAPRWHHFHCSPCLPYLRIGRRVTEPNAWSQHGSIFKTCHLCNHVIQCLVEVLQQRLLTPPWHNSLFACSPQSSLIHVSPSSSCSQSASPAVAAYFCPQPSGSGRPSSCLLASHGHEVQWHKVARGENSQASICLMRSWQWDRWVALDCVGFSCGELVSRTFWPMKCIEMSKSSQEEYT